MDSHKIICAALIGSAVVVPLAGQLLQHNYMERATIQHQGSSAIVTANEPRPLMQATDEARSAYDSGHARAQDAKKKSVPAECTKTIRVHGSVPKGPFKFLPEDSYKGSPLIKYQIQEDVQYPQ